MSPLQLKPGARSDFYCHYRHFYLLAPLPLPLHNVNDDLKVTVNIWLRSQPSFYDERTQKLVYDMYLVDVGDFVEKHRCIFTLCSNKNYFF